MGHEELAQIIECKSWKDLYENHDDLCQKKGVWIFRGQKDYEWDIKTTFERLTDKISNNLKHRNININAFEFGLLRKFKREFPLYSKRVPEDSDIVEWFSLMQHHGAPTRLADWTYSLYVATYFALENIEWDKESAVWAISSKWL